MSLRASGAELVAAWCPRLGARWGTSGTREYVWGPRWYDSIFKSVNGQLRPGTRPSPLLSPHQLHVRVHSRGHISSTFGSLPESNSEYISESTSKYTSDSNPSPLSSPTPSPHPSLSPSSPSSLPPKSYISTVRVLCWDNCYSPDWVRREDVTLVWACPK